MSKILVINSGSTSLKYKLFRLSDLKLDKEGEITGLVRHEIAVRQMLRTIGDLSEITCAGHRFVHGGKDFYRLTEANDEVLSVLQKYNNYAPLHNPYNLAGVKAVREYLPNCKNYIFFDTAFFHELPLAAKVYALPLRCYEDGLERYGFHGLSHEYAARRACEKIGKAYKKAKLITIHLGGGSSAAAIANGQPLDTSMGFTPLEGLVMQTRCGDIDPSIVLELLRKASPDKGEALKEVEELLNRESGLKGLCGCDNYLDMLTSLKKNNDAWLAWKIYVTKIKKYIGAYWALLNGADALVFTGKIGAGRAITRKKILENLDFIKKTPVVVVATNEELLIAQKIKELK